MRLYALFIVIVFTFIFIVPPAAQSSPVALNRIEGTVRDHNGVPVAEAFVELSNWVGNMLGRTRTTTAGRFAFAGISSGRFIIKVLPLGKNLLIQEQDVEISNQNSRSDIVFVDFVLQPDRKIEKRSLSAPGVIFVQDVPAAAKELCETGVRKLDTDPKGGLADLERAVAIFPNYFDALYFLGSGYSSQKQYEKAYQHLMKAVDINDRSPAAYYMLAYAFYQVKEIPAALMAVKSVLVLNPSSIEAHLLYGTLLRLDGKLSEAESILKKAKSLDKGKTPGIYWELALVLNKQQRNQDAARELKTYLEIAPESEKKQVKELIEKLQTPQKVKSGT